jgi:predicted transcriptional regulator
MRPDQSAKQAVALTLRIPSDMLSELDDAAWRKHMTRTAFIRESLARNLSYFTHVELSALSSRETKRSSFC